MRRAATILPLFAFPCVASAQTRPSDERFFDAFLPLMVGAGVLIVIVVIVANVVAARRRFARMMPPRFDPTLGPGPAPSGGAAFGSPRTVSKTTTTTTADGSVTVTVVEETIGSSRLNTNGVVDPELFGGAVSGDLEREILNEVKEAFRHINAQRDSS